MYFCDFDLKIQLYRILIVRAKRKRKTVLGIRGGVSLLNGELK